MRAEQLMINSSNIIIICTIDSASPPLPQLNWNIQIIILSMYPMYVQRSYVFVILFTLHNYWRKTLMMMMQ